MLLIKITFTLTSINYCMRRDILKNLDAVMAQSHISITETRWVIVNSTHFCNAWLAIIGV